MPDEPWTEVVNGNGDDYPYPRTHAAVEELFSKYIPEDNLWPFFHPSYNTDSMSIGESLRFFHGSFREKIEEGAALRAMIVRDIRMLQSALDKLYWELPLESDELDILALDSHPDDPDKKKFRYDVVGEIREHFEGRFADAMTQDESEEPEHEEIILGVAQELERDVTRIALIFEEERGLNREYSSPCK